MRRFEFVPKNVPKPQDGGEIGGTVTTRLEIPMKLPIEGPLDGCIQSETEDPPPTVNVSIMDSYVALSTVSDLGANGLSSNKHYPGKVVEIGAGTGLPGLVAASLGSKIAKVTLTDGDDAAVKRLEENVMGNSISIPCEILKLRWGEFQSESVYLDADIVLGADIIPHSHLIVFEHLKNSYDDWHMEVVVMTAAWLLRGKQRETLKVKPCRPREFWLAYHNRGGSRSLRPYLQKWGMNGGQEIPRESYLPDELLLNPNYLSVSVLRFCVPCE